MAVIKRDNAYMEFPLQISRQYGAPIDKYSIFYSQLEATTYATTSPLAYVGQIIVVVLDDSTTPYLISNTAGDLVEVGKGINKPMLFVATESEMLALQDVEVGQQVYREDKKTIWIFKGGDTSQLANWVESAAQNDTIWSDTNNKVLFTSLTQTAFESIETKNSSTLYFTDAGRIYKGSQDVTSSIIVSADSISVDSAVKDKLYINPDSLVCKFTTDGVNWKVVTPGYATASEEWDSAGADKFATIGLIKKGIKAAIDAISLATTFDTGTGKIQVGEGSEATLTNVAHDLTYNSDLLKLTIPQYGKDDLVINIPKDKFVTAGKYYEDYPEENPTHHKVIVLTIDNQSDPVIIPAEALVNIYTPNNEGKDVTVTISEDNKISASLRIDPVAGNAIVSTAEGVKVDISTKLDKLVGTAGSKLILSKADGTLEESLYAIQSSGDMSDSASEIAVTSVVKAFVNATVSAAKEALQVNIDNKVDKVIGNPDNIVIFADAGALKDSGKTIGSDKLKSTPDANTLATEAAVADAISWTNI